MPTETFDKGTYTFIYLIFSLVNRNIIPTSQVVVLLNKKHIRKHYKSIKYYKSIR